MHGGLKVYRGSPAAARQYVEADRSRADDYYLAEGAGVAERYVASPTGAVRHAGTLTGDAYEAWVGGYDVDTGAAKGRLRTDDRGVRFVEVVVNGPKSWSLAASLHPQISAAYDAAQDAAARQIIGWLAEHATTRVGPRGRQVQVPVSEIEAVTVRHYTSRAGDPHRHLHLQVNARVYAEVLAGGSWRGLHTVGVRDSLDALNGIGHASVMTDPGFRAALAAHGYSLDPESGEVAELAGFVAPFSARARQIARNVDRYEAQWRSANPDAEPGPRLRRSWDARAWADARPDKVVPTDGAELAQRWVEELHDLGHRPTAPGARAPGAVAVGAVAVGELDRDQAVATVLARLGGRRSGWNAADVRGEMERLIASAGIVATAGVRLELAEDLTDRAVRACVPLIDRNGVPEHIRALCSQEVLDVEADLVSRILARTPPSGASVCDAPVEEGVEGLDAGQRAVVDALAGRRELVVVEGAAGAGKTTTLAAVRAELAAEHRRLVVVTPTLKAATVAAGQVGAHAFSAARLAYAYGYRWDADGVWTRLVDGAVDPVTGMTWHHPAPGEWLRPWDLLLVDEAGMLDQDTARALFTIADEAYARLALVGDRHQLPAVGRGGVLDLAARWAAPDGCLRLESVHRFSDPQYARLSLAMRTGEPLSRTNRDVETSRGELTSTDLDPDHGASETSGEARGEACGEPCGEACGEVFDALWVRDQIRLHPTEVERTAALAGIGAADASSGEPVLMIADTREQVTILNATIRDQLVAAGRVDDTATISTGAGERLGVGDRVATRRNDRDLNVANRDTWVVAAVGHDGSLILTGSRGDRSVPAGYAREHVELAYATTVYGAQGETVRAAHLLIGEHTGAAAAYVGMTRGRDANTAHLVADSRHEARQQWIEVFSRDRADLGPAHAARLAAQEAAKYATYRPLDRALADLRAAWTEQSDLRVRLASMQYLVETYVPYDTASAKRLDENKQLVAELADVLRVATTAIKTRLREPAIRALPAGRLEDEHAGWEAERRQRQLAAQQRRDGLTRSSLYDPGPYYSRPDPGRGIGR